MNYTERMGNVLFEQWDNFDDYADDYSALIEALNSEDSFRTFGDGLLFFLQKRNSDLTAETAIKYIEKLCDDTGSTKETILSCQSKCIGCNLKTE